MSGTYVTNITHFLDEAGELQAEMPRQVRQMASFLVLLIDAVTQNFLTSNQATGIRCRTVDCTGKILASLATPEDAIVWRCPHCRHEGIITNWQGTKWDCISAAEPTF